MVLSIYMISFKYGKWPVADTFLPVTSTLKTSYVNVKLGAYATVASFPITKLGNQQSYGQETMLSCTPQ